MRHGARRLSHDVFLNANLAFVSKLKKTDGTIVIETSDITAIQVKVYNQYDDMATATATLQRNMASNPTDFAIDNTNKQIAFDIVIDALPLGNYIYQIIITKNAWTEPKAIYVGKILKHSDVNR